jgi:hypothetical protein
MHVVNQRPPNSFEPTSRSPLSSKKRQARSARTSPSLPLPLRIAHSSGGGGGSRTRRLFIYRLDLIGFFGTEKKLLLYYCCSSISNSNAVLHKMLLHQSFDKGERALDCGSVDLIELRVKGFVTILRVTHG